VNPKSRALAQNLGAVFCWCAAPILIRYTRASFPVALQTFFRYLASLTVLWVWLASSGQVSRRNVARVFASAPRFLVIVALNYCFQMTWTITYYRLLPGLGSLLFRITSPFSVLLAVLLFPDEHETLRSWRFLAGLPVALAGVCLTVIGGSALRIPQFGLGVLAVLISAASWAGLGAAIKRWLPEIPPSVSVTTVFTVVTPLFLLTHILVTLGPWAPAGRTLLPAAPPVQWILMLLSGLIGVGLGHSLFYRAVPVLGVTLSSSLGLLTPFLTGILSFAVFGETFPPIKLIGGGLLIVGALLVVRARFAGKLKSALPAEVGGDNPQEG
jgi:drug/metabolite transporter (DMT)-like permease